MTSMTAGGLMTKCMATASIHGETNLFTMVTGKLGKNTVKVSKKRMGTNMKAGGSMT